MSRSSHTYPISHTSSIILKPSCQNIDQGTRASRVNLCRVISPHGNQLDQSTAGSCYAYRYSDARSIVISSLIMRRSSCQEAGCSGAISDHQNYSYNKDARSELSMLEMTGGCRRRLLLSVYRVRKRILHPRVVIDDLRWL